MMNDIPLGSCSYTGVRLCQVMDDSLLQDMGFHILKPIFSLLGLNSECSFDTVPIQEVDLHHNVFDLVQSTSMMFFLLQPGDFSFKMTAYDRDSPRDQPLFCGHFKFTVKKGKSGNK